MKKILLFLILACLIWPLISWGDYLATTDYIMFSGAVWDSSAHAYNAADSVRITVYRNGVEEHDAWYNSGDDQATVDNGKLVFFDQLGDLDDDAGDGMYYFSAEFYDESLELYEPTQWQTHYLGTQDVNVKEISDSEAAADSAEKTFLGTLVSYGDYHSDGDTNQLQLTDSAGIVNGTWVVSSRTITGDTYTPDVNVVSAGTDAFDSTDYHIGYWHYIADYSDSGAAGGGGATAQEVWEYGTRTLTAFAFNVTLTTGERSAVADSTANREMKLTASERGSIEDSIYANRNDYKASGFAVSGDPMTLTTGERQSVSDSVKNEIGIDSSRIALGDSLRPALGDSCAEGGSDTTAIKEMAYNNFWGWNLPWDTSFTEGSIGDSLSTSIYVKGEAGDASAIAHAVAESLITGRGLATFGSGIYACTLLVLNESDSSAIVNTWVTIRSLTGSSILSRMQIQDNEIGIANLNATDHSYSLFNLNYVFNQIDTVTIAGNQTDTLWGSIYSPSAPPADMCMVTFLVNPANYDTLAGTIFEWQLRDSLGNAIEMTTQITFGSGLSTILIPTLVQADTSSSSVFENPLFPNASLSPDWTTYWMKIRWPDGDITIIECDTIPEQDNYNPFAP